MALSTNAVIEVNQTALASDANGGAFDAVIASTFGNDMTYGTNAAVVSGTFSATGTSTITSSSAIYTSSMVGNTQNLGPYGVWVIKSITSSTACVVDTTHGTPGTFTAVAGVIGGPLASPGYAASLTAPQPFLTYLKAATYAITTATPNVSGGVISGYNLVFHGYNTTRGDNPPVGSRPVLSLASTLSNTKIVNQTNNFIGLFNLSFNGNNAAGSTGVSFNGQNSVSKECDFSALNLGGSGTATGSSFVDCYAASCTTGFYTSKTIRCVANSNTTGFNNPYDMSNCIAINNSGVGIFVSNTQCFSDDSTSVGNGTGISIYAWAARSGRIRNVLSTGNTTDFSPENPGSSFPPFTGQFNIGAFYMENCAILLQPANFGDLTGYTAGMVALTADPIVRVGTVIDVPSAFAYCALNNVAGGGAACRGAGTPQYLDIGAVQSQGGGAGKLWVPSGFNSGFQT